MSTTATVETLTAEVRVLMVGNRQITISVYKQLDYVRPGDINAFGRVRSGKTYWGRFGEQLVDCTELVGELNGNLVRSWYSADRVPGESDRWSADELAAHRLEWKTRKALLDQLPLIVLAGLR